MPASVASSTTVSSSQVGQGHGVMLTPTSSEADQMFSIDNDLDFVAYSRNANDCTSTPTASIALENPACSTSSLSYAFAHLTISNQKKALRHVKRSALAKAFAKSEKTVLANIFADSASTYTLIAGFTHLEVEDQKLALAHVSKSELKAAFKKSNGRTSHSAASTCSTASSTASSITSSIASVDTLQCAFGKLSVENQVKALANIDVSALERAFQGSNATNQKAVIVTRTDAVHRIPQADLAEWQELCQACGVDELPTTITKCKQILKTKNVALSDLQEAIQNGTVAQTFPSLSKLRNYIVGQGKIANKAQVKENRFLKQMLRELFNPRHGKNKKLQA